MLTWPDSEQLKPAEREERIVDLYSCPQVSLREITLIVSSFREVAWIICFLSVSSLRIYVSLQILQDSAA